MEGEIFADNITTKHLGTCVTALHWWKSWQLSHVCVATTSIMMYGKQLLGKSYHVNVSPGTRRTCCSCSTSHDGKVLPLIVVGSHLFVNCGLPWLNSDCCGALCSVQITCVSIGVFKSVKHLAGSILAVLLHLWILRNFPTAKFTTTTIDSVHEGEEFKAVLVDTSTAAGERPAERET